MARQFSRFHPSSRLAGCVFSALIVLGTLLPLRPARADLFYKVQKAIKLTDSGLNPAADGTIPISVTGLDDAGAFVGYFPSANANKLHAFLWDQSHQTFLDLNARLAADSSLATCINQSGTVAGVFWEAGTYAEKGFIYYPDGTLSTFTPPAGAGGHIVSVTAINNHGDLIGSYADANGVARGYTVQQGASAAVITDLGDLGLTDYTQYIWPNALNEDGQIVGNTYLLPPGAPGVSHTQGFFWDSGMTLIDASDLGGNWTAISLNASGQVVGLYGLGADPATPFSTAGSYLWDGEADTDLGNLGGGAGADAFVLLDSGLAFGTSLASDGLLHLFEEVQSNFSGVAMADWGSVSLYAGDGSFLPTSLSAAVVKLVPTTVTPDAVGPGPRPPRVPNADYYIAGFGTDASGKTRALLWNNFSIHNVVDLMPGYLSFTTISNAYGSRVLINGSTQIACAGTDTSGHQMALLLSVDPDTDNDGLPDSWEMQNYGYLGVGKNDPAAGGGGLTNWQAYQQGVNPNDFYNGQAPRLTIVSVDPQTAAPGSFLPKGIR